MNLNFVPVSVVIPCYNCADTIERAIESVVKQTVLPQEIICIDDRSTDSTWDLLERLKSRYEENRIKLISQDINRGPGSARNAGWNKAVGEKVAFLDSDDAWHPQKLEIQYGWMLANPESVLSAHYCGYSNFTKNFPKSVDVSSSEIKLERLLFTNKIPTLSVMLNRSLTERFRDGKRYAEDYLLWLDILLNGHRAHILRLELARKFKPEFGAGGLSGNLTKMEKGEIDCYRTLREEGRIKRSRFYIYVAFSIAKWMRRWVISKTRSSRGRK